MMVLSELTLDKLTPEKLEEIYYDAYKKEALKAMGVHAVIQYDVRMAGWQAVLDAVRAASDLEWAQRYLATRMCEAAGNERNTG